MVRRNCSSQRPQTESWWLCIS